MNNVRRGRLTLVLLALLFAAPILVASVLALSGWLPEGRRNYGELVDPPVQIATESSSVDGKAFAWTTAQWHWTLLVRIPERCDAGCRDRLDKVSNLRVSLGRHAAKLRVATDRTPPSGVELATASGVFALSGLPAEVSDKIPAARDDVVLALIDPAGYLMLRYPEQADLSRVRKDLGKLIR